MANTYTLISSVTVGAGGASSIDFTSIPATYTDLKLVVSVRDTYVGSVGWANQGLSINSSTAGSANWILGYSTGTQAGTDAALALRLTSSYATANTFSNAEFYFPNYSNTTTYKSFSQDIADENNNAAAYAAGLFMFATLRSNTAAISSLSITAQTSFAQYSTAYLYGIKNS